MYCAFCNSQLPEGDLFCPACGSDNTPATNEVEKLMPIVEAPKKQKKAVDPLSAGISALVWSVLSVIMSFGGLFLVMSFEGAIAGIIMAIVSKSKAKAAKAYEGTVGAVLAKVSSPLSTFALVASIYILVTFVILIATVIFIYLLYFIIMFIALVASTGSMYYYY